jgi:hypothetical protein
MIYHELGYWQYNEEFAQYHTISTHYTSDGCFSYGGFSDVLILYW